MLHSAQIHDIDKRHAQVQEGIDGFTREHVGPNLRVGLGAERAMEVATQKMGALGSNPYEVDRVRVDASDVHWKEYVFNMLTTEGQQANAWGTTARQRIRSAVDHARKGTTPI